MSETRYMISQASRLVQVETHVLRYWEEELDLPIARNQQGHRYYTGQDIQVFMSIKELKKKGFQLRTIHELIPKLYERIEELQSERHQSSIQVKLQPQLLQNHSTEIPKRTSIVFQTETQSYTESVPDKSTQPAYAESVSDKSTQPAYTESAPDKFTRIAYTESVPDKSTQPAYAESAPDKSAQPAYTAYESDTSAQPVYAAPDPNKPMPITPQEDEPGVKPGVTPATIDPADKPIVEEPEVEPFPVTQPLTAPTHEDKADTFRTIMRRLIGEVKKERQQDEDERLQTEDTRLHEQSQRMVAAAIEQEKLPGKRRWFSRKGV